MIVDLDRFIEKEGPYWDELTEILDEVETRVEKRMSLDEVKRFHYLYERVATDLTRLAVFPAVGTIRDRLESLVARAYTEIHETRAKPHRFSPVNWFFRTFPRTVRRHAVAFWFVVAMTAAGAVFGGMAIGLDTGAKEVLLKYPHLRIDPSERVAWEEEQTKDRMRGRATSFSTMLMTHNTKVSITAMALGMSWGIGTMIVVFSNGVLLGAVVVDYVMAGETQFLAGWLLPHGAIEIPAILIAGQAGLVLGLTIIGRGSSLPVRARLRVVANDIVTLIFGVALMMVWAGVVEAFLSQYHEPTLPYWLKILFGVVELVLLTLYLAKSGTTDADGGSDRA